VAYRKLEVKDVVKVSKYGHENHGMFMVVEYVSGDSVRLNNQEWFYQKDLLLSVHEKVEDYEAWLKRFDSLDSEDLNFPDNEELYKGNLLERIVKLEQEIVDLKKRLT